VGRPGQRGQRGERGQDRQLAGGCPPRPLGIQHLRTISRRPANGGRCPGAPRG
jgi:hypothetical protein